MKNAELINTLIELQTISEILGSEYREAAYRRAINELKKLNFQITPDNLEEFARKKIPGVGKGIMAKIREFISTGEIAELINLRKSPRIRAYREFSGILGVGPSTIEKWLQQRIDSLPKLRRAIAEKKIVLTHMQKIGLRYYDDLNSRIPRAEVTQLGSIIKSVLLMLDPNIIFCILGSYRRGTSESGDVDILVSNKTHFDEELIPGFISLISSDPNFISVLVAGKERVTLLYKSPFSAKVRQIDVLNIAYGSYFAAMNYFTGGFIHNAWIRLVAKKQGYRLNQAGLFKYLPNGKLQLVPIHSEEELYKILGVAYIPPEKRQ